MTEKIAVIGGGLIGRAWTIVFARAGHPVVVFDAVPDVCEKALALIKRSLDDLQQQGLVTASEKASVTSRINISADLAEAVRGAAHVHENVPEELGIKQAVYRELDRLAPRQAILASSTSALPASSFTETLAGRARCLVAHPVNPPHLVPLVELVPAPWTDPDAVERTRRLMQEAGQTPITLKREIQGFVLNRLQGALLAEAFRLVEDGVCDTEDVDRAVSDGLGLRWSFMGPFETIDLNAPAGIVDYCRRFGPMYYEMAQSQSDPREWSGDLVSKVERQRRRVLPDSDLQQRQNWRDRRLAAVVAAKKQAEKEIGN